MTIDLTSGYPLKPKQFVLGKTHERVSLPIRHEGNEQTSTCLAARFEGKSSRARTGLLVHFTAPTIHPGFSGTITLEIINLAPTTIALYPSARVCQPLMFSAALTSSSAQKNVTRPG